MHQAASQAPPAQAQVKSALLSRPFVPAAAVFILGIALYRHITSLPLLWLLLACAAVATAVASRRRLWPARCALALALLLTGLAAAQTEAFCFGENDIAHFTTESPRLARIECEIITAPRILTDAPPGAAPPTGRPRPPRQVARARITRILTTSGWQDADGHINLRIHDPLDALQIRQRAQLLGMLARPAPAMNPGQTDWRNYYRDQRILAAIDIAHSQNVNILSTPRPGILDRIRGATRDLLARGFAEDRALDHALLRALVLGDSDPLLRDVHNDFIRTGTSHHLAISGLHIAIVGGFVLFICRCFLLRPRYAVSIALLVVLAYGAVALPSPPVVRSVILCVAFGIGICCKAHVDGVQLLSVSVFVMLLWNPLDFFNAGFQLSFGTVLGLMILVPRTTAWLDTFRDRHEVVAEQVRPRTAARQLRRWLARTLRDALVAGLVAWFVATPLVAFHFGHLNPWATLSSLLLAIPVFLALLCGVLKIVITLLLPFMAGPMASLSGLFIRQMREMVEWFTNLPAGDWPVPPAPLWMVAVFYLLVLLPLVPVRRWRLALRFGPVAAILLIIGQTTLSAHRLAAPDQLRLTLLSVGAGQCAVVQTPAGKLLVFDAGSASATDLAGQCIDPYLRYLGRRNIDGLYISHANQDHYSAVAALVETYGTGEVWLTPHFSRHALASPSARATILDVARITAPRTLAAGARQVIDSDTHIEVLWPPGDVDMPPNDSSMVVRLTAHGRTILFTGDIQQAAQRSLLRHAAQLKADILIAPHHGSREPTTAEFLAAVDPQIILSSNDRTLSQKQRQFDALAEGRAHYRSHRHGAITVTVHASGVIGVEGMRR